MISYDTGTKVRVIVANPDGPGTRETTGIVMAGPRLPFYLNDTHMVLLTTPRVPNIAIQTNPEILILPVLPDGFEVGTRVYEKKPQSRWITGRVVAGPMLERFRILDGMMLTDSGFVRGYVTKNATS